MKGKVDKMSGHTEGGQKIGFLKSVTGQMIMWFLLVSLVPVLIVAVILFTRSQSAMREQIYQEFTELGHAQDVAIEQWLGERMDDVGTIADDTRIRTMNTIMARPALMQFHKRWNSYEMMVLVLPNGDILTATNNYNTNVSDRDYFQAAMQGEVNISEPVISPDTGKIVVVFAAPVIELGQVVGVAAGVIPIDFVASLMEGVQLGESSEAYLVNADQVFITGSRYADELLAEGLIEQQVELELVADTEGIRRALAGNAGVDEYEGYRGTPVLGAYQPIAWTDWALLIEQDEAEAFAVMNRLQTLTIILVAVLAGVVATAAYFVAKSFLAPLMFVVGSLGNLKFGDLNRDIPQEVKDRIAGRGDEFGLAGKALAAVERYLLELSGVAVEIADGNLLVDVTPHSKKDELQVAFKRMATSLREKMMSLAQDSTSLQATSELLTQAAEQSGTEKEVIVATIREVATAIQNGAMESNKVASMIGEISRAIDGVSQGAQEQAKAVQQASQLTNEMNASIAQVAEIARKVKQGAELTTETAQGGSTTVEQTIQGMQIIKEKVDHSAERVREMGERSNEIGAIIETINDIASQTNLLALNAAIEAARAGEHGKGFAVVADEVRKLAERSASATDEIDDLIKGIQETIKEAVVAMEDGASEVDSGVKRANEAGEALTSILEAVRNVDEQATTAAEASDKMKLAAEELISSVDTVSSIVEENTAATEEMAASSSEATTAVESIASVSEENSASIEEVSASVEEMNGQVEEVNASAQELSQIAQGLAILVSQFRITEGQDLEELIPIFEEAHKVLLERLRHMLEGKLKLEVDELGSDYTCKLGKWYFGRAQKDYGEYPAFRNLAEPHWQLHEKVEETVSAYNRGEVTQAQWIAPEVDRLGERVLGLLDELREAARS